MSTRPYLRPTKKQQRALDRLRELGWYAKIQPEAGGIAEKPGSFDGIHPIQPQCMDIKEVKEYVHGKMAVLGNIDCRDLLVFGSQEEVKEVVKQTIEKTAPGGGYIISSSNSIHPGCKPENYIAMVEASHQYGVYNS